MKNLMLASTLLLALAAPAIAAEPAPAPATATPPSAATAPAATTEGRGASNFMAKREAALAKLPAAKAELVRNTMKTLREESKSGWEKTKAIRAQEDALLKAPQFDRAAYIAKAGEMHAMRNAQEEKRSAAIADLAAQLTPEERTTLIEVLGGGPREERGPRTGERMDKNGKQ